jgi:hypothetical protein
MLEYEKLLLGKPVFLSSVEEHLRMLRVVGGNVYKVGELGLLYLLLLL